MMTNMKAQTNLTPSTFEAACKSADWYFQYSDDRSVYLKGKVEFDALQRQAKEDPTLGEIFNKYCPFPELGV